MMDTHSLKDSRMTLKSYSSVVVDSYNGVGTFGFWLEFSKGFCDDETLIIWLIIAKTMAKVGTTVVIIDNSLMVMTDEIIISNNRDIQKHITAKDKGTRGNIQRLMDSSLGGMDGGSKA